LLIQLETIGNAGFVESPIPICIQDEYRGEPRPGPLQAYWSTSKWNRPMGNEGRRLKANRYQSLRSTMFDLGSNSRTAFTPVISRMIASMTRKAFACSLRQPTFTISRLPYDP